MKNIIFLFLTLTHLSINAIKLTKNQLPDDDLGAEVRDAYTSFLGKYQRNFKDNTEFKMRAKLHKKNKDMIEKFNKEESQSAGYTMEIN